MALQFNNYQQQDTASYYEPEARGPSTEREKAVFCLKASAGMLILAGAASLVALMVVHSRSPELMRVIKSSLVGAPALPVFIFGADRLISALTNPEY